MSSPSWKSELIKKIRPLWVNDFPFLRPATPNVIPYRSSNSIFTIEPANIQFNKWAHIDLFFTPKAAGEFTVELIVSESETVGHLSSFPRYAKEIQVGTVGVYRVGGFMDTEYGDYWWALKDNEGEFLKSTGLAEPSESEFPERREDLWRPADYNWPFDRILDEAVAHVSSVLRERVFPGILANTCRTRLLQ